MLKLPVCTYLLDFLSAGGGGGGFRSGGPGQFGSGGGRRDQGPMRGGNDRGNDRNRPY